MQKRPSRRQAIKKARVVNVRGLYFVELPDGTSYQVDSREEGERDIQNMLEREDG